MHGPGSWMPVGARLLPAPLTLFLLAGCAALPTPVVIKGDAETFQGMTALAEEAPGRPLHVLLVHGMGTPTPNGFDLFIASLAARFGFVQIPPYKVEAQWQSCHGDPAAQPMLLQPPPEPIDNPNAAPQNQALLYTYNFAPRPTDPPQLTVSYLLWAPLTAEVKCGLEGEDNSAPQKQAFAAIAKDFIDDKLADALLYAGSYRQEVIRPSVQGALCKVTGGEWHGAAKTCVDPSNYHDPTAIITHSLGGYMLMDSIQAELHGCQPNNARDPAEKILENTPVIYMMANQLALLNLSTLRRDPQALKTTTAINAVTKQFAQCWLMARAARARSEGKASVTAISHVVAFSDPNDILSWRVEPKNLRLPKPDWGQVAVTNVYMSNGEFSAPGLFSDPTNAHTGYFVNPTVMDMLICGINNDSPCAVSVSAH
jgi:hypothetical protein